MSCMTILLKIIKLDIRPKVGSQLGDCDGHFNFHQVGDGMYGLTYSLFHPLG